MRIKSLSAVMLALIIGIGSADAAVNPSKSRYDFRIQHVNYNPEDVVNLRAGIGVITSIVFQPGEEAVHFGSGFTSAWDFEARDNIFFLRPKDKEASTNVTVVTNVGRIYHFKVDLVPENSAVYNVTFAYPEDEKALDRKEREQREVERRLSRLPGSGGYDVSDDGTALYTPPKERNFNYTMNFGRDPNSKFYAPQAMWDDGTYTYIKFKDNVPRPRVFARFNEDEMLANFHIEQDGTYVLHGIYPALYLRKDAAVVGLYNENYENFVRSDDASGDDGDTTVAGVRRVLKNERQ